MLAENLPQSLTIEEEELKHGLNAVELAVGKFWSERTFLQHYTNHGLDHSERIVAVLGQLLEEHPDLLNKHERFILLASVYLHDIGMQSPTHAGLEEKEEYTLEEMEQVRENHHEASAEMILESISPEAPFSLGLNDCRKYVYAIAEVAKYHRKLPLEDLTDTALEGETIRLPLLAALLRLGDALDADDRRVNMDFLKIRTIPTISKFHWWSHHYVQSVSARKGHIKLLFKFPEQYRDEEKITAAFREKVEEDIKKAFFDVYDILDKYGLRLYRDVEIEDERYAPAGELEPIQDDLLGYITEAIIKPRESLEERTREAGVLFYVDGAPYSDDEKVVECLKKLSKLVKEERYSDVLKELDQCLLLIMPPKEKMIFLNIAGICNYILGNLAIAKKHHEDCLKISDRKDLQEIYKDIVKVTRAASLGNIGLVYQAKGELDEALKYLQDALKIFTFISPEMVVKPLLIICILYSQKQDYEKSLDYLGKVIVAVKSESQFTAFFRTFAQIVAEIVKANDWAALEKVNSFSEIIADKKWVNFFIAIHKFARYKQTLDKKHKKDYETIRKKLEPELEKMLDALLKERAFFPILLSEGFLSPKRKISLDVSEIAMIERFVEEIFLSAKDTS